MRALAAEVPYGALALLPFYSRIAATLSQVFPDIGQGARRRGRRGAVTGGGKLMLWQAASCPPQKFSLC